MAGIAGLEARQVQIELADHVHGVVQLGAVDHGGAGALVARLLGELTDDGHLRALLQGQDAALVLEQDDGLLAALHGEAVVGLLVEGLALQRVHGLAGGQDDVQQLVHADVHLLLADTALIDRLHQLPGAVAAGAGHLQVGARAHALHEVVAGAPVGDHEAVEAPFVPQDLLEQVARSRWRRRR